MLIFNQSDFFKIFLKDTFPSLSLFPQSQTHCAAVHETAIEKGVCLTRRIIASERGRDDQSLIRHVLVNLN